MDKETHEQHENNGRKIENLIHKKLKHEAPTDRSLPIFQSQRTQGASSAMIVEMFLSKMCAGGGHSSSFRHSVERREMKVVSFVAIIG